MAPMIEHEVTVFENAKNPTYDWKEAIRFTI